MAASFYARGLHMKHGTKLKKIFIQACLSHSALRVMDVRLALSDLLVEHVLYNNILCASLPHHPHHPRELKNHDCRFAGRDPNPTSVARLYESSKPNPLTTTHLFGLQPCAGICHPATYWLR